jgi:uncharacterized damage-inducible protein DinB
MTIQVDSSLLRKHVEYTRWATLRTLAAVKPLSDEEITRDLRNSFGSVLGTLEHIFAGDRIWLSRLQGNPRTTLKDVGESFTLASLEAAWRTLLDDFVRTASDLDPSATLHYRNLKGVEYQMPIWQIIMHVVNHGTHHRGQVVTMLRQLGYPAPALDLHVFFQELAAAAGR